MACFVGQKLLRHPRPSGSDPGGSARPEAPAVLEWSCSLQGEEAMTRPRQVLGGWTLIASLTVSLGLLAPAVARNVRTATPATTAPGAVVPAATPAADGSGLSSKEKALLEKINALKAPRWRTYGACRYDWTAWKLTPDGVRSTTVQCGGISAAASATATPTDSVAVHCDSLKLSIKTADQAWSSWRLPYSSAESSTRGGEDLMVVALCANAKPTVKPLGSSAPAAAPPANR